MARAESEHRRRLLDLYTARFGANLVPIRREDVRGFLKRRPFWLVSNLKLDQVRQQAWEMEEQAANFYREAARMRPIRRRARFLGTSPFSPVFAAAFATSSTSQTFLVGLAAAVGAGISMGITEVASDDGKLTGRGSPIKRGVACGAMTAVGGLGHALPYLIPHFFVATAIAMVVVMELWAIAFIQSRYMSTPFWRAALQIVVGGALVFGAGILIGSA